MTKRALLVGINDYPGTQNDLMGCLNDVTNLYDVLVKYFGFQPGDIRMLTNARAKTQTVLDALAGLVEKSQSGDVLVFQYSGHGSQVRDLDGDELKDHKDEILCPYDCDWDSRFIRDDDLAELFSPLKQGVLLEVILDSCHSGTGTREMIVDRGLAGTAAAVDLWGKEAGIRQRFLAPPADVALRADEIFGEELPLRRVGRLEKNSERKTMEHILWAACRSNQYSADAYLAGRFSGAFTYFFCKHIRSAEGAVPRSELLKRVRASLRFEGFSQVPQLEGAKRRKELPVFSPEL